MRLNLVDREFYLIRDIIHDKTGIFLGDNKRYLVETRLSALVIEHNCKTFSEFYLKLKSATRTSEIIIKLVDAITTNETLWFRDNYPFKILQNYLLPEFRSSIIEKGENIHIWSAACSTGQEPYSIAMTILESDETSDSSLPLQNHIKILATDISKRIIDIAQEGVYDDIAMGRGLSDYYRKKYFTRKKDSWEIKPAVKKMITFKNFNLKEPMWGLKGPFDIIFIRNVMIYFADEFKKELLVSLKRILKPNGYIFLGTGENIMGHAPFFHVCNLEGGIFFQSND